MVMIGITAKEMVEHLMFDERFAHDMAFDDVYPASNPSANRFIAEAGRPVRRVNLVPPDVHGAPLPRLAGVAVHVVPPVLINLRWIEAFHPVGNARVEQVVS